MRPTQAAELDDLLAAVAMTFAAAREAIQRRQFAHLLRATRGEPRGDGLAVMLPRSGELVTVPALALLPAHMLELAELAVEFDCVPTRVYSARGRRIGLRVVGPEASEHVHRARITLSWPAGSHILFSLDGRAVRASTSEVRRDAARRGPPVEATDRRTRPVYLLTGADARRVAEQLGRGWDGPRRSRATRSRSRRRRRVLGMRGDVDHGEPPPEVCAPRVPSPRIRRIRAVRTSYALRDRFTSIDAAQRPVRNYPRWAVGWSYGWGSRYGGDMSRLFETELFVRVVEEGSFTAASRRLAVTTSYASKLVTRLEQRLGVALLIRTTRKLVLTEAGRVYFDRCAEAIQAIEAAEAMACELQSAPRGKLRITLPNGFGIQFMLDLITEFKGLHPELTLELVFLDRHVDLIAEGYDVAIRAGDLGDPRLIARKLAGTERVVCGSPGYLERCGAPESPDALARHACLQYAYHATPGRWKLRSGAVELEIVVSGAMVANNSHMVLEAAIQGHGLIFVPMFHVVEALRAGRLRRVLPAWHWPIGVYTVYPPTARVPIKIRVFVDFMVDRMRDPQWAAPAR
jgi:DNA-binding transcriptional LysR family regulator